MIGILGGLTIFGVQVPDLKRVLASFYDIVVAFIQICHRSQFWPGELCNGAQTQSVRGSTNEIDNTEDEYSDGKDIPALVEEKFQHCRWSLG